MYARNEVGLPHSLSERQTARVSERAFALLVSERTNTRKEMSYLTTHPTHFTYGCMASDIIW